MKKLLVFVVAVLFGLSISGAVFAGEQATSTDKPLSVKKEQLITATATVEAIDLQKRVVTLKGPKGNVFDVTVGEEARNLPQVKVGDEVKVKYYESIALRLVKPGEGVAGIQETESLARARQGEKPGGVAGRQVSLTATITAINKKKQEATLKGPDGKTVTVKAENPKNLEKVKVGDQIEITYTEALAISVEKAKKK
jgi:Cu/Ag efflux protein CusF